jgi:hypothetical protein
VIRRFFPLDKNYLLEEAQLSLQDDLLTVLVQKSKEHFELIHNPLHLMDSFSQKIKDHKPRNLKPLYGFYQTLAGIYRYKFGDSQLEFLWSGESHFEKYQSDWGQTFGQWTDAFLQREQFIQAVLDLTVFLPENRHAHLAENRMNYVMLHFFELKIHKNRGIVEMKVA